MGHLGEADAEYDTFLASAAALGTAGFHRSLASAESPRTRPPKRSKPAEKKIAVVCSVYWYLSHAYHIAGRFLDGYMVGDEHHFPEFGVASVCVEQLKNDLSRDLASVHCPALVIHGRQDPIPFESSESIAKSLNAELVPLDACGHVPYVEQSAKLFSAVREFLRHTV